MPKTFIKDGYVVKKKRFKQGDGSRERAFELQKDVTDEKGTLEEKAGEEEEEEEEK